MPVTARPYVWWHWMGANFSKAGITKDLEAMKAAGIGGATIFNLSSAVQESQAPTLNNPWPDQTYRSPKYWAAIKHAAAEFCYTSSQRAPASGPFIWPSTFIPGCPWSFG